ncbi:TOMM precursor leader peptide-binding protein [Saccharothrix australiensis]|uniref:Ribosomal protein S12 methylthiotransferase accessory factor n=1 Tax=Saccharothrix australiensis TaxID=2072 RepID=A0A495W205_9PSEU|nr:TOMM precursor leader peptide-binding protein [Saccharothrix australiensis]RKT54743.1 ribosomal protein S12 methylthiotransferase accessory factor [Saccharothrix australiensis]
MSVVVLCDYAVGDLRHVGADGVAVLPVRHDGAVTLLGPVVGGGPGVCLSCAEDGRLAAQSAVVPRRDDGMRVGGVPSPAHGPLVDALTALVLADPDAYRDRVLAIRVDVGTVAEHPVRTRPEGCPVCGPLPDDTAASAVVARAPAPVSPGTLRGANPRTGGDALRAALVDPRHGPVDRLTPIGDLPLPAVSARIVTDDGQQAGFGRTATFAESERVALFEAVERLAGMRPRRTRTVLEASFAELGPERAVDPTRLGLPDFPSPRVTPYTPDTRTRWVHGWSYSRGTTVAVPEHAVYWGGTPGTRFLHETSNGCGTGNSLTEAVLYGLFEIAERDAFLMAWYQRTPLRALVVRDELALHLSDRLEQLDYRLECYDATNDLAVPAVLALARYTGAAPSAPRAFFAAGAGVDPDAAVRSAVVEVAVDVESAAKRARADPAEHDRERLLRLLREPELIRTMEDHVAVNGLPEAADRYDFLRPDDPVAPAPPDVPLDDLDALLEHYVTAWAAADLEVIAVDLTDPPVRDRLGLHSAKVVVPGTLPMTFGERDRRTRGMPRLRATGPLPPHPFP